MAKNVLLTGGSGFVGKHLTEVLIAGGFSVSVLSRSDRKNTPLITYYKWDIKSDFIEEEAVLKADYIIHLAGEGIVESRWTEKRKKAILESRTKPIELIYSVLKNNNKILDAFVSSSAVGIYGATTSQEICSENTAPANDFLGMTCQKWESTVDTINSLGIRTVKIRTGIVLGKDEGFLKKITPGFKAGFGAVIGSGKQYIPWIHIEDLCHIYAKALTDLEMNGAYNAAVTDNTTNAKLSRILAHLYGYKIWVPKIPAFVIKLILGEMSIAILEGKRVSSEKIQKAGYEFLFIDIEVALSNSLS
ncbi:TIGR01777 family protein [Flavobacterium sp. ANB]|uniref:TIGR01777 family oxidoreductase n=1 Tax=unclassified Flavobacterium TaxID=196869 RepID=UPI0012B909A3|nr:MULTISPECIES: TIGR01777 family oxidoreductase [unclassified Flavobacterium]MBF4518795.1 TIGR01777 family protein [Flavobacterium sp. ANB]MTD71492.1 TIGR01777 family protein [Flavobacterium sp. LC2016-13]